MIEYGRKCEDHNERGTTRSFSGNICKLTPRTILNALWLLVRSRHLRGLWNRGAVANFSFKRMCGASFCWLAISIMDLHLAAQILTGHDDEQLSFFLYEHE